MKSFFSLYSRLHTLLFANLKRKYNRAKCYSMLQVDHIFTAGGIAIGIPIPDYVALPRAGRYFFVLFSNFFDTRHFFLRD